MTTVIPNGRSAARADDDVFIRTSEGRRIVVEYDRATRWPWPRIRRVRKTFRIGPLPLHRLLALQDIYAGLAEGGVRLTAVSAVAALIGPVAFELPGDALDAIWSAHLEENRLPKGEAAPAAEPGSGSSSASSASPPSTSPAGPSSG